MTINESKKESIENQLGYFTGTTGYHRLSILFPNFLLTDGTKYLAESCGAHWLFDLIASYQTHNKVKKHPKLRELQFWILKVNDSEAIVTCEWDKDQIVLQQKIDYTDFPLEEIKIWVAPTCVEDKYCLVAYLPSEH